jgi:hypothetical protein
VNNSVVSSINDIKQIDKISTTSASANNNKMLNSQPYPINLKVEKLQNSQSSIIISWDTPPIIPITDNNSKTYDLSEQLIVNYQIYLNHELHSLIKPNQNRSLVIDKIDFNKVKNTLKVLQLFF